MIVVDSGPAALSPIEAYGLQVLLDQSRLLPLLTPDSRVTLLRVRREAGGTLTDPHLAGQELETGTGVVFISSAQLAAVGRLAGAVAEQRSTVTDHHGRVPARENPLGREGHWTIPIVSRAALRLAKQVSRIAPDPAFVRFVVPWPEGRRWAVALTHDLDLVTGWPLATALRLTELARHRSLRGMVTVFGSAMRALAGRPVEAAALALLERLRRHGVRTTWFILCGTPSLTTFRKGDLTYLPEAAATRRILAAVIADGHEIGLHGSFATETDATIFAAQRSRLQALVTQPITGVRQHFLRMHPGPTHRAMQEAGFQYDATYGFPDRSGYRLGAADIVPGWDASTQQPSGLEEVPLVWMDRTLSKYAGVESPEAWVEDGLASAAISQEHEGLWVGLWHPNLSTPLGFPGAELACENLVTALARRRPYFGTLSELVDWRQRRRAVRAQLVLENGTPVLTGPEGVAIEDSSGLPAPSQRVAA